MRKTSDAFRMIMGGSLRPYLKTAAMSFIALTATIAAARARDTTVDYKFSDNAIVGNNDGTHLDVAYGSPINNTLFFKKGAAFGDESTLFLYGGMEYGAAKASANGNTVTIDSLTAKSDGIEFSGGYSATGAAGNAVIVNGGEFTTNSEYDAKIVGAISDAAAGNATYRGNAVTVNGGVFNIDSLFLGGAKVDGTSGSTIVIDGNAVNVKGGAFGASTYIYGGSVTGYSDKSATVKGNAVNVTGGEFYEAVILGGYATFGEGGADLKVTVADNKVKIAGGAFTGTVEVLGAEGQVYSADGAVTGNTVTIAGGTFDDDLYVTGAAGRSSDEGKMTVRGNAVTITGGKFEDVTVFGASGMAYSETSTVVVEDNTVTIAGGKFDDDALIAAAAVDGGSGEYIARNNKIVIYGDAEMEDAILYGVYDENAEKAYRSAGGNELVFGKGMTPWSGADDGVELISGFDKITIAAANWDKPIKAAKLETVTAKTGKTAVDATNIAFAGVKSVTAGDETVLLEAEELEGELELSGKASKYTIGATLSGTGTVAIEDEKKVTYTIDSVRAQAQSHTVTMGMIAGVTALNQGADTVLAALKNLSDGGRKGLSAFAAMGGGTARQETGSHVNLNAFNFATGLGSNVELGSGMFTVGGAFEAGYGSFKNHFYGGDVDPYLKKSGHLHYYGAAATAGMNWNSLWHVNGAFRLGYAKSEQASGLYNPVLGASYDVDIGAYYVGTELGGGKAFKLNDMNAIDVYARYFWLHRGDDDFYADGDFDLKSVDSHRLRAGARYDLSFGNKWGFYAGLAYEYEFDGKSRLFVDGYESEASKIKGGRAFGELGVKLTPEKDAAGLSLDFNVKGAAGSDYRGVLFGIDAKYMF